MQYVQLGNTDMQVSRIAFGCMSTVANPTYDGMEDREAVDAIRAAIDLGMNFIDTAPGYGNGASEELLGRALEGGYRDKAIVADKVNTPTLSADDVYAECEKSLKLLRTDRIDLYQIHWPKNVVPIQETLGAMQDLVKQGKVRALGVCNFGPIDLAEALEVCDDLVTNQISYSLLHRAVEFEVSQMCVDHGLGMLCYSPLAQALLAGKFDNADQVPDERARTRLFSQDRPQARHTEAGCETEAFAAVAEVRRVAERVGRSMADVSLAWLLQKPGVACVLVGASRVSQVERNAKAIETVLSPEDVAELDRVTEPVMQLLGANMDPWVTESRIR